MAKNPPAPEIPASLIDEFGDLQKLRDEFAPTEALYQKRYKELKDLLAAAPPEATFVESGERWTLDISARRFERTVDVKRVRKRLGVELFLRVCSVSMKALESYLLKPEIEALTSSAQTGSRTYAVQPIE